MGKTRESGDLVSDNLFSTDISNDRVGLGSTQPSAKLDVSGIVTATSYFGSGIGLTATVDAPDATYGSESALLQITVTDGRITDVNTHTLTSGVSNIAEVIVLDNDVSVGTAGTINFGSNLSATPVSEGITTVSFSGTIDNSQLAGNISNDKLVNDSVTYGGVTLSLGSTDNTPAFDLSDATNYPYSSLTGVTTDIVGDSSPQLGGDLDVNNNDITGTGNINLTGIVTATTFSGSGGSLTNIPNSSLDNSTVSYGGVELSLGGSDDTPAFDLSDATNYPYSSLTGVSTDIVGDNSPQLGGNLDVNNNDITGTGNINLTGIVTATSFFGDGSGLTGVAKTGNINADTLVVTGVSTLGVVTATSFFGDGSGLTGLANTASINTDSLVVTGVLTATSANFSGDISIADKITHIGDADTSIRFPSNDNFAIETAGTERVRVGSAGSIGIGTDDPSQRLEVIGNLSLVGKIIAGNRNHLNLNFDNLLDFNATTGIKAFRPINFIDTSATVKIARITDSSTLDSAVEFQTWNSTITTNTSYWDVYGGPNGLALRDRFPGRVNNRLFVGTGGNILIGSNNSSATNSSIEVNANGTDNILQVQGNTYISGDVGIGTTSANAKVHIGSDENNDIAVQADGNVRVGISTTSNFIAFHGTFWDGVSSPGVQQVASRVPYTHTYIGERIYNYPEDSELLLYKGNDNHSQFGTDRIRYLSGMHEFQLINDDDTVGTFEEVGNFAGITTALLIDGIGETGVSTVTVFGDFAVNGDFESDITVSTGNSITGSGIGLTGTVDVPDATYGSESSILQITVSDGRITDISAHTITSGASDIAEVIILDNDVSVGTAGTINFGSNLSATPASAGIVTVSFSGTISNDQLAGSIANGKLANSTVSYGGVELSLGGSDDTPAFDLSDATNYPYSSLTGVSTDIVGDNSPQLGGNLDVNNNDITGTGNVNLAGVITALSFSGSLATTDLTGTITNTQLAGSISNGKLSNSEVSYGGVELSLGQADPTPAFDLSDATDYRASALTGTISNSALEGSTSLIITSNLNLYVATNGNDSTGDGSISSPWATPTKAAEFLSQRRIKINVSVTVNIGAGTYTFTSNLKLGHPQGSQIKYVGATPTGTKPRGTTLNGNSGGTAIRGNTTQSEQSNNDDLQAYYNTIIKFNNSKGFVVGGNYTVVLQNILILGNGGGNKLDGVVIQGGGSGGLGGSVDLINCAIHNFSGRGLALVFAGNATLNDLTITNCKTGISNNAGIILGDQSSIGGTPRLTISNCTGSGFVGEKNSSSRIEKCFISNNGGLGIAAQEVSNIRANESTIDNNGTNGVFSQLNGTVVIRDSTVSNNGFDGPNGAKRLALRATDNSYIDFRDSTLTGNRSESSPALNTLGNATAFIRN